MKNKFILALTLVFVMAFNVFAGCAFMGTNSQNYYNTVIAKVGDVEITKSELVNAYNSYGYDYVQSSGYSVEEALDAIVDQLVNREVLVKYISDNYASIFNTTDLEPWEKGQIWQTTFDYVNESELLDYINNIRKDQGMEEIKVSESDTTTTTTTYTRDAYNRQIHIEYDIADGSITKITRAETQHDESIRHTIDDFKFEYYGDSSEKEKNINKLAIQQFYTALRVNYKNKHNVKTVNLSDQELLNDHLNDLYDNNRKSYIITKFQENYEDSKEITFDAILTKVKETIKLNAQKYGDEANKSSYISAVQKDASTIYYHPYQNELVYVTHILIKYDKDDTNYNLRDVLKGKLDSGELTQEEYEQAMSDTALGNECKVYKYENGVMGDEPTDMNANDLYAMIDNELSTITNEKERLNKFIDFAYEYNQDTGMFSSEYFYTVQLDTTYADTMVAEFADLSRKLYNEKGVGSYGICFTDYGAHIVYIAGLVENLIVDNAEDTTLDTITIDQLRNIEIPTNRYLSGEKAFNPNSEPYKTMLDVFAEKVNSSDYNTTYITEKIKEMKNALNEQGIKITTYKNRYSDLYK